MPSCTVLDYTQVNLKVQVVLLSSTQAAKSALTDRHALFAAATAGTWSLWMPADMSDE